MISVIIPVYNGEATIGALIESLLAGNCKDFEIIVVDDGSTDRTREIAQKYTVTLLATGGRRGPAVGRNIGAKSSRGNVLLFLDADTLAPAHLVGHVAGRFDSEPKLVAVVGYYDKRPLNPGRFPRYKALMVHHWFRDAKVMESFETCCGAIRKEAFFKAGAFNESYTDADVEDYEFGHRVIEQGPIEVDHRMIVGHHFPSFAKNFNNYVRRSRLWTGLFLKRRRFESTATTSGEGVTRLLGALIILSFVAGVHRLTLLCMVAYVYLLRKFLRLLNDEEGPLFMIWGLGVHMVSSLAVMIGVLQGLYDHYLKN